MSTPTEAVLIKTMRLFLIDYENVNGLTVNLNQDSPLEFVDEVEIEYIKYIYNYKYAYYKINNKATGSTY